MSKQSGPRTPYLSSIIGRGYGRWCTFEYEGGAGSITRYRDYWAIWFDDDLDNVTVLDVDVPLGASWLEVLDRAIEIRADRIDELTPSDEE